MNEYVDSDSPSVRIQKKVARSPQAQWKLKEAAMKLEAAEEALRIARGEYFTALADVTQAAIDEGALHLLSVNKGALRRLIRDVDSRY